VATAVKTKEEKVQDYKKDVEDLLKTTLKDIEDESLKIKLMSHLIDMRELLGNGTESSSRS